MHKTSQKGFTLLELLIVVAILATLSAVTVVVLNPAELLKKARDSQRLSDLSSIKTAVAFYMTSVTTPDLNGANACVTDVWITEASGASALTERESQATTVDGLGWIPIDLAGELTETGSPLASFPLDPVNGGGAGTPSTFYSYFCDDSPSGIELAANMESSYYKQGGTGDVESKDGGQLATIYETGTVLGDTTGATTVNLTALYTNL